MAYPIRRLALNWRVARFIISTSISTFILCRLHPFALPQPNERSSSPAREQLVTPEIRFRPSTFDWKSVPHHYPTINRQQAVRDAFLRCWTSYKKEAWLRDELAPITGGGKTTFGGWAATLVEALDTLWIMGLREDFAVAASAAGQLDWANTADTAANLFETTIRHLGGLLAAYDLSGEKALLDKATELGNMLYMAFDIPNHDPSASPCSLSLEFTRLAQLTGDDKFYDAVSRVTDFLERTQHQSTLPGMWPKLINFCDKTVDTKPGYTLGALSNSLSEYLLKMAALLGGQSSRYEKVHRSAMSVVEKHLLFRPMLPEDDNRDILFVGDAYAHPDRVDHIPESQHLSCFAGGMFAPGGRLFDIANHMAIGKRLARGCARAYNAFPSGLIPEIFKLIPCDTLDGNYPFDEERDSRYILRPEAIESIFLLYRMTGKEELRDVAWRMFELQCFWLSYTLKYFYLIFSPPDVISLDKYVFNPEAHPLRRPD
ncbi:endoplasmic reticulum mannosyl-oligosaccharide 1,2-alpha-mannosidase [Podospora australis]|uniref:alpha-1,2-Mannosidase n=1 Tax=Podospora australis TaxID=1536484 RepID=A0AAN7AHY8_9PEZI|nr:endoplasmic reticulum mannosyl-oligosaccharide 1,2-alpha-mannosidase [Podospora australis]